MPVYRGLWNKFNPQPGRYGMQYFAGSTTYVTQGVESAPVNDFFGDAASSSTVTLTAAGNVDTSSTSTTVTETVTGTSAGTVAKSSASTTTSETVTLTAAGGARGASTTVTETVTLTATGTSQSPSTTVTETVTLTATGVAAANDFSSASNPVTETVTGTSAGNVATASAATTVTETVAGTSTGATGVSSASSITSETVTLTAAGTAFDNNRSSASHPVALAVTGTAAGNVATSSDATLPIAVTTAATGPQAPTSPTSGSGKYVFRANRVPPAPHAKQQVYLQSKSWPLNLRFTVVADGLVGQAANVDLTAAVDLTATGVVGIRSGARLDLFTRTCEYHDRHQMVSDHELRRLRDDYELLLTL